MDEFDLFLDGEYRFDELDRTLMINAQDWTRFSTCLSRRICVIVTDVERQILGYGVNHPINNISCQERHPNKKRECPRRYFDFQSGEGMVLCNAVHAEVDALNNIPFDCGIVLYMSCAIPCLNCSLEIVNDGRVRKIYCKMAKPILDDYPENEYHFSDSFALLMTNEIPLIEIDEKYLF